MKNTNYLKQIELAQTMINEFVYAGEQLPFHMYISAVAMLVEERCKADGKDTREVFDTLHKASIAVVNELGLY